MSGFVAATALYETWMAERIPVVRADLERKHELMARSAFALLRGSFYRWVELYATTVPEVAAAPHVLAVGDLHVENFGTWRDAEGRLVWGVDDVDEAHPLPYTIDLVRLAASVRIAVEEEHLGIGNRAACTAILDGYAACLQAGGRPLVLEENDGWLRAVALGRLRDPARFWTGLRAQRAADTIPESAALELGTHLPAGVAQVEVVNRRAGVGSLGRPRLVAIGLLDGALVAREAKAWLPSAATRAEGPGAAGAAPRRRASPAVPDGSVLLLRAVRCPDPMLEVGGEWIVRRLAPDCSRIEMSELPGRLDEERLLRAMGWETANLHLGSGSAVGEVVADLGSRPQGWLRDAARAMTEATREDWKEWRRHMKGAPGRQRA